MRVYNESHATKKTSSYALRNNYLVAASSPKNEKRQNTFRSNENQT